jgi:hypothetical protein
VDVRPGGDGGGGGRGRAQEKTVGLSVLLMNLT